MRYLLLVVSLPLALSAAYTGGLTSLMQFQGADPSKAIKTEISGRSRIQPFLASTGERTNVTAYTAVLWLKTSGINAYVDSQPGAVSWAFYPSIQSLLSVQTGIGHSEGNTSYTFPTILSVPETNALPLVNGAYSETCLVTNYLSHLRDHSDIDAAWGGGCYAMKVVTDTALDVTVGNNLIRVLPNAPTGFVRNVQCAQGCSRTVTIQAEDPEAVVYFGLAVNPFVEFHGDTVDNTDEASGHARTDPTTYFIGLNDDEYQMAVIRAKMRGSNLVHRLDVLAADVDYWHAEKTNALNWIHGRGAFEANARIELLTFAFQTPLSTPAHLWRYGVKLWDVWLDNAAISRIRDYDVREMQRRGIVFPRLTKDYWRLTNSFETVETHSADFTNGIESVSGAKWVCDYVTSETTGNVIFGLVNGTASTNMIGIGDVEITAHGADHQVSHDTFHYTSNGNFTAYAVDRVGNVRTNSFTVSLASKLNQYRMTNEGDVDPTTWTAQSNFHVLSMVSNSTAIGTYDYTPWGTPTNYTAWQTVRIPCAACAGSGTMGNQAMPAISPHVFSSARHYPYGWYGSRSAVFVSEDLAETGTVNLARSMIALSDWALAHGFSESEASCVRDVVLGVIPSDESAIPGACCPYFLTPIAFTNHFGTAGVLGWTGTQTQLGMGVPCRLNPTDRFRRWISAGCAPFDCSATLSWSPVNPLNLINLAPQTSVGTLSGRNYASTYSGDSGLGIYLHADGKWIMVSHFTGSSSGPDFIGGLEIFRAFCTAQGDTLKVIEE